MMWRRKFKSQSYGRPILKHIKLPVYETDEFDFYRCVEFKKEFYGKTASELFNGNLRICEGRYSKLFLNQKISYWADSPETAKAEIKKHGSGDNILTFWAYDDGTSTFPILLDQERLRIIDGRDCGIQELIDKADDGKSLSPDEIKFIDEIMAEKPDCLVYNSHARDGGENYIFFEKGFNKLALRKLKLNFCKKDGGNKNVIICADGSDYNPFIDSYGEYFAPKAKVKMDKSYMKSEEYLFRKKILEESHERMRQARKKVKA